MSMKLFKRAAALILALALMISLLPAIAVAAGEDIVLNFGSATFEASAKGNTIVPKSDAGFSVVAAKSTGANANIDAKRYPNILRVSAYLWGKPSEYKNSLSGPTKWPTGMFTVAKSVPAGVYTVKMTGALYCAAAMTHVYIDGMFVGSFDGYDANVTSYVNNEVLKEKTLGTIVVDHTGKSNSDIEITFCNGASSEGATAGDEYNNGTDILLSKLTLTPVSSLPTVADVEIAFDDFGKPANGGKIVLPLDSEAKFTVRAKMSDGTYKEMTGFTADFAAKTVTADANNVYSATVSGDAIEYTQISDFKDSYALYKTGGYFGGSVKGVSEGELVLTATATIDGTRYTKSVNIDVVKELKQEPVEFEFSSNTISGNYVNKAYVSAHDWVYSADNWELVKDETTTAATNSVKTSGVRIAMRPSGGSTLGWGEIRSDLRIWMQYTAQMKTAIVPGYYSVKFTGLKHSTSGKMFVYVGDEYAGAYETYEAGVTDKAGEEVTLNTVYLSGRPKIKFALGEQTGGSYGTFYKVKLEPVKIDALSFKNVKHDIPAVIYTGDTAKIRIAAQLNDGSELHYNGYKTDASADTSDAVAVSVDGANATVTDVINDDGIITATLNGVSAGNAKITVSGKYNDVPFSEDINIEVKNPPMLGTAELILSEKSFPVGYELQTSLELTRTDGEEYTGEYTVVYASSDENVVKVSADGVVTAIAEGNAKITATVSGELNASAAAELDITVIAKPEKKTIELEYSTKNISGNYDANAASKYISPQEWIYTADNWIPVLSETTAAATNVVKASGVRVSLRPVGGSTLGWAEIPENLRTGMQFTSQLRNYIAPGYYKVTFTAPRHSAAGKMFVYVGGQYAGAFDTYLKDASDVPGAPVELNTVYLTGKPKVMFALGEQTGGSYGTFYKVKLEPVEIENLAYDKLNHNVPEVIYQNDSADIRIAAMLNDGSEMHYNGYNADASADLTDEIKATVEGTSVTFTDAVIDDGIVKGKLTGVELGVSKIKISGKYNNVPFEGEISVEVKETPKLNKVDVYFEKEVLPATRETKASFVLTREDGAPYADTYEAVWESSDKEVATVDSEGNITAKSEGTSMIKATVTAKDGTVVSGEKLITVSAKPVLGKITASPEKNSILIGGETGINVFGKMNDDFDANVSDYIFKYESLDENIITVDENGKVTGVAQGETFVVVSTKNESGEYLQTMVTVKVYEGAQPVTVDFTQTVTNTDYSLPSQTPGYRILADISASGKLYAKYSYAEAGKNFLFVPTTNKSSAIGQPAWPSTKWGKEVTFAIEIDIPFDSDYAVEFHGGRTNNGGFHTMYIDDQYLGDYTFYGDHAERLVGPVVRFNTVHLNGGKHTLYIHLKKSGANYTSRAILNYIKFMPVGTGTELSHIDLGDIPEVMAVGEVLSGKASARMSDGSVYNFTDMTSEGKAETENVISASSSGGIKLDFEDYTVGKSGEREFSIAAESEGTAEFEVTASVNGKTVEKIVNIAVKEDPIASASGKTEAEEIFLGDSTYLIPVTTLASGRILNNASATSVFTSETPSVATVDENGLLTAIAEGEARIKVETTFNGKAKTGYFDVTVLPEGMTDIEISAGGSQYIRYTGIEGDTVPLYVSVISNTGRVLDTTDAEITAESLNPEYATVDAGLNINPVFADENTGSIATFRVTVKLDGRIRTVEAPLTVVVGKSKATYYTEDKIDAVRENIKKFNWAESAAKSAMTGADFYVDNLDAIYDLIHSEGLPRIRAIGVEADPMKYTCKYCGNDNLAEFGAYPWKHNALTRPWKIECPKCKRLFPSNDFGGFHKLGLNEYGEFDYQKALDAHHALVKHGSADAVCNCENIPYAANEKERTPEWYDFYGWGDPKGYLYNQLHKDVATSETALFREGERVETWGVDDGYGYIPLKEDGTPYHLEGKKEDWTPERHTYIAEYFFHGLWRKGMTDDTRGGLVSQGMQTLLNAYYYTGEIKYGRALAILTDRIADFYPYYDMTLYNYDAWRSSDTCQGKLLNHIWECSNPTRFSKAYDLVFELYEDPAVLNYIKNREEKLKFRHAKNTPSQIRTNVEDGILRASLEALTGEKAAVKGRALVAGNFGYPQVPNALCAVILDTMPDTSKWLDYLMAPGWNSSANSLGGGITERLVDVVDHDGQGNENSGYNTAWHTSLISVADVLENYDRYPIANFYNMPKFVRMFYANIPLISTYYTPNIGDTNSTASKTQWITETVALRGWKNLRDPIFAQILYMLNGNKSTGMHYDIETPNPDRLAKEVQEVIDTIGVLKLDSDMMTGFGFAMLRDGGDYTNVTTPTAQDTRRNVWMYFGSSNGHGHPDTMNLGMTAFGLNFMPDNGYPEETGMQPNRLQWVSTTLAHNTVSVNEKSGGENLTRSKTKHFDGGEIVQLVDVDAPQVYKDVTDIYRRSIMMIKVDDMNSYTVDFFRILGGNDHLYSFHASSDEIAETNGLEMIPQVDENGNYSGTYVGMNVEYTDPTTGEKKIFNERGPDPNSPQQWTYQTVFPRGYTWVDKVDRDNSPDEKFEIDFVIKDFNKAIKDSSGLRLRMTMLDSGNRDGRDVSVATVNGYPPNKADNKNIPFLRYVFVKHTAKDKNEKLDTMFTTVFEPYRNERFIKSTDELEIKAVSGTEMKNDVAKAIRVEHVSGRIDYILYATNNKVTYEIKLDDETSLSFRGFVGVWTVQNGENTYKYLHDGDILGESTGEMSAIEGVVANFTQKPSFKNEIIVKPQQDLSEEMVSGLAGKFVIVQNDATAKNGAYKIESASLRDGDLILDIGNVTLVTAHKDAFNPNAGYFCNIAPGQTARIPLTYADDHAPEFDKIPNNLTTSAGSEISVKLNATSDIENTTITYSADILPRGASFDAETAMISWKPTSSQVGINHFAITATDNAGRTSTVHFNVTVYGSTTSGGGGGSSAPSTPAPSTPTIPATKPEDKPTTTPTTPSTPTTPEMDNSDKNVRFIDLGNHAWAADAINALADEGIIKGTSENTFSPAANITRADFAILLVRAFKLSSENTENFADVSASDYFAKELAVARNTGLVNGIGENKFAPRNNITRQDMMVIVYRALAGMNKLDAVDSVPQASDFDEVADYAKEAVSALVNAKLVNGKNGLIDPTANTTRVEVAVLIQRILDFVK